MGAVSGGQLEFILGELLNTEDFSKYEGHWRYMWYARRFMEQHLPFWEMTHRDELLSSGDGKGEVLALPGKIYAVYLHQGGRATLDLTGQPGNFTARWYNPREGVFQEDTISLSGGRQVDLPAPPREPKEDNILLIKRD